MSNFNDLYDHVAADRSRAMQLLGIQDIRRKAVAELLAAGAYTEPDNIDDMTDAEREQKAEAFEKAVAAVAERERMAEKRKWRILFCILGLIGFAALMTFLLRLYDVFG